MPPSFDALIMHRRYLPHLDGPGVIQMVTFRLADALPASILGEEMFRARQRYGESGPRKLAQHQLDRGYGSCLLKYPQFAGLVEEALLHFHGERYDMLSWVVMPNHVHVTLALYEGWKLFQLIKSWKMFTARRINAALGTTGPVWFREYFDRVIRDLVHLESAIAYIHHNPVKAGLVMRPEDWTWSSARHYLAADIAVGAPLAMPVGQLRNEIVLPPGRR